MTGEGEAQGECDAVRLTKAVRIILGDELKRTGVTAIMLLSEARDVPHGLTAGRVNRWMNGLTATAPINQYEYVVARWAALPSADVESRKRGKRYPTSSTAYIEVTDGMAVLLRAELARTGIDHATLLDGLSDIPNGLNARIIKGWLYQEAATTRSSHWLFVIAHLASLPNHKNWHFP